MSELANRTEKRCPSCSLVKQIDEFGLDRNRVDGRNAICKLCRSSKAREDYKADPAKVAERVRKYNEKNMESVLENARRRTSRRRARLAGTERLRAERRRDNARHRAANPLKTKARQAAADARKSGRLIPSHCEVCGASKVEFHHAYGYDEPNWLRGQWLCRKHHQEADYKIRSAAR